MGYCFSIPSSRITWHLPLCLEVERARRFLPYFEKASASRRVAERPKVGASPTLATAAQRGLHVSQGLLAVLPVLAIAVLRLLPVVPGARRIESHLLARRETRHDLDLLGIREAGLHDALLSADRNALLTVGTRLH